MKILHRVKYASRNKKSSLLIKIKNLSLLLEVKIENVNKC